MEERDLIQKAKNLGRLDRECIELSYERAKPGSEEELEEYINELMDLCEQAFSLWNEIKLGLGQITSVRTSDSKARETLKRIRDGYDFFCIRQYRSIFELVNTFVKKDDEKHATSTEEFVQHRWSEFFEIFHSCFDVSDYYLRKAQIGCIVVAYHSDKAVDFYYSEIRESYAFGLHRACTALCRALLELVLHDALQRRNKLDEPGAVGIKTGRERRFYLPDLINKAKRVGILAQQEKEMAFRVKNEAEKVLHLRDRHAPSQIDIDDKGLFELIRDTVRVVERVFAS